jgi:hypothetical protein
MLYLSLRTAHRSHQSYMLVPSDMGAEMGMRTNEIVTPEWQALTGATPTFRIGALR